MCLGISVSLNCFLISSIFTLIVLLVVGSIGFAISLKSCSCDGTKKIVRIKPQFKGLRGNHSNETLGDFLPVDRRTFEVLDISQEAENIEPIEENNPVHLMDFLGIDPQTLPTNITNMLGLRDAKLNLNNLTDAVHSMEEIRKKLRGYLR